MSVWKTVMLIFIGGGLGASSRFALAAGVNSLAANTRLHKFPIGIMSCNLLGCFLIGCVFGLIGHKQDSPIFPFLVTGFLGGFTTFSTFGKDSHSLFTSSLHGHALLNIVLSVSLGILAVSLGYRLTSV